MSDRTNAFGERPAQATSEHRPSRGADNAKPAIALSQAVLDLLIADGPGDEPTTIDAEKLRLINEHVPFQTVGFTLSSVGHAVSLRFKELLAPLNLEPREFALLRGVAYAEGISQQAIAERLQIPPSRMVAFVDALETRGLIERRSHPRDRRIWALHLTDRGRDLLGQALQLALSFERELCADFSEEERASLMEMLSRVGRRAGAKAGIHTAHTDLCSNQSPVADAPDQ